MYCTRCGTQNPDDAAFCYKCGTPTAAAGGPSPSDSQPPPTHEAGVLAPSGATQLKCPSCGAPLVPKFGEMVITCDYCGGSVTLGSQGWKNIQKHTMLPLRLSDQAGVLALIRPMMDKGVLRWNVQEHSTLEEFHLMMIPYWVVPVSARTSIVAADVAAEAGTIATTAVLIGVLGAGFGGGQRRGVGPAGGMLEGMMLGTMMGGGMGGANVKKAYQLNDNYNFPIIALKALTEYQPSDFEFALGERVLFDSSKVQKSVKILNGDVGEDMAKYQAKTIVNQLQSQRAHANFHMIQQLQTEADVGEPELLHVPVWFAKYTYKNSKIVLVIDGNSGKAINSIGI